MAAACGKTVLFFEFSLGLSRTCLGKTLVFGIKMAQKARFSLTPRRCGRRIFPPLAPAHRADRDRTYASQPVSELVSESARRKRRRRRRRSRRRSRRRRRRRRRRTRTRTRTTRTTRTTRAEQEQDGSRFDDREGSVALVRGLHVNRHSAGVEQEDHLLRKRRHRPWL